MNKFEVLLWDGHIFIPEDDALPVYDLINKIMISTGTSCWQSPGQYEFRQKIGFIRYEEQKDFIIDCDVLVDVLMENGYTVKNFNDSKLPVAEIFVKDSRNFC